MSAQWEGKGPLSHCRTFAPGHRFDPLSGWCDYGCGTRDDGRMVKADRGVVAPGPEYTSEQLQDLLTKATTR